MPLNTPIIAAQFSAAYEVLMEGVGEDVTLMLRQADDSYISGAPIKAKVSELRAQDLVPGSTARVGDLRIILRAQSIPAGQRRMESKDRVQWRGRQYAVLQYDDATASVGGQQLGVNLLVRG